jgi:hypothetical protein
MEEEFVNTGKKVLLVTGFLGAAMIGGAFVYQAAKKGVQSLAQQIQQLQAQPTSAPPGWNYCTDPSYYIRACETSPYTRRWTGGPTESCPSTAICGAHTANCVGADGITYAMMDQGGARYYPRPQNSAGVLVQAAWDQCYVSHIDRWGPSYPCTAVTHPPGGVQAPTMLRLDQLPPGNPQIPAFCALYQCTNPPCATVVPSTPTITPTLTPVCPVCPTCPPARTPTPTPHLAPNKSKTPA